MFQKFYCFLFIALISLYVHSVHACDSDCVKEDSWAAGIAVGFGKYSNPLHDGKDRNVSVLPSFYYYGEKFYIENTEVGYVLEENADWMLTLKGKFNNDGLYFNESKFDSIIISDMLGPGWFEEPDESVSVDEVDRKYSYMAGLGANYFLNENFMLTAGAYHDITGVHYGYSLSTSAQYFLQRNNWQWQAGVGIEYKNSDLTNYYYGLRPEDGTSYVDFNVKSTINFSASATASYRLNDNFFLTASYYYEWLDSNMTISPIVEDTHTQFFFLGITAQYGSN
ncbi:MipA/OmpV family protein [Litorilituus lipolyticus]|uniref:MipA/OmpV family protein n=1 Tax=Litorilituus lipolyticus TaxID=2491017 RepID=A0A502KST6_9GAMM|nr:MipA/OmpV family protein [Litorilituus lipolyticus]TPH14566.1 MipA/OmpV family protein [Litorilituus lipolyticus]